MKEITKYVADDGKEFYDEQECLQYETNIQMFNAVKRIHDICKRRQSCSNCVLYSICDGAESGWFQEYPDMWNVETLNIQG